MKLPLKSKKCAVAYYSSLSVQYYNTELISNHSDYYSYLPMV